MFLSGAILLCAGAFTWEALELIGFRPFTTNMYSSPSEAKAGGTTWHSRGSLFLESSDNYLKIRAWAPSFSVIADGPSLTAVNMEISNVPPGAIMEASGGVKEYRNGLIRHVEVPAQTRDLQLRWNASPDGSFSFAVTGDIKKDTSNIKNMAQDVDFVIIAGDLVGGNNKFPALSKALGDLPVPVYTVAGNHDLEDLKEKTYVHTLSPYNYYFTYGEARFIFFNNASETLVGSESEGVEWLESQLKNSSSPLTFLFMHRPPFHDMTDTEYKHPRAIISQSTSEKTINLIAQTGVNAVFCGHIHEYHHWQREGVAYIITGEGRQNRKENASLYARVTVYGTGYQITEKIAQQANEFGESQLSTDMNQK